MKGLIERADDLWTVLRKEKWESMGDKKNWDYVAEVGRYSWYLGRVEKRYSDRYMVYITKFVTMTGDGYPEGRSEKHLADKKNLKDAKAVLEKNAHDAVHAFQNPRRR